MKLEFNGRKEMKNSQIIESKLSAKRSKKKSQGKLENTER
jgi:hypothetical protein